MPGSYTTRQKFDQEVWRFRVQVAFSAIVLGLCIVQLMRSDAKAENTALYWGGVTSVLAYWLPSPGQNKSDERDTIDIINRRREIEETLPSNGNGSGIQERTVDETTVAKLTKDSSH